MTAKEIAEKIAFSGCTLPGDEIERMILRHMEDRLKAADLQGDAYRKALKSVLDVCVGKMMTTVGAQTDADKMYTIARDALYPKTHVNPIRPPSPQLVALARKAIKALDEENRVLAGMTEGEREKYIGQWAERLAADCATLND